MDNFFIAETDDGDGFEWGWEDEWDENEELEFGKPEENPLYHNAVRIEGWDGIAFFVDDCRAGKIECHMIGDDRKFTFDNDDATLLDEEEFCWGCGAIGCGWGH